MNAPTYAPIRTTSVDQMGLEARADELGSRSIKTSSKRAALHLAVRCIDLTTLEGADTPGKVASLCRKATRPDATNPGIPPVAAVCVYPEMVAHAASAVAGTGVAVASVAGAFPSGLSDLDVRTDDIRCAVADGAEPTAERVTVSGAVERYLRVTTTGTFTNATFIVTTRRGTSADDVTL